MTIASRHAICLGIGTAIVVCLAVADAVWRFAGYAADPTQLWQGIGHDRHAHFSYGLDLALALRDLAPLDFFNTLGRAVVWPPLHGLVLATTLLIGGIDLKLAILPSLAGWTATIVLIWLIGLRLFADTRMGVIAGAIAVAFAIKSPAFRLITADVMLEGVGAALSCFCIYCYLRAREAPQRILWWRVLALALTALFFEKFNYWLLTLVPLALAFMLDDGPRLRAILAQLRGNLGVLRAEARHPLTLACIAVLAIVTALAVRGPWAPEIFGTRVSLYPPGNLLTLAYALLFARIVLAWWRHRPAVEAAIGMPLSQLAYWHALPAAAWFLIPKRLLPVLWYLGPTHYRTERPGLWPSALGQWDGFASGFHVAPWAAIVVALGVLLSLVMVRRAGPAVRTVALVALIGAAAVVLHPQQQLRFQTTVLPPLWILAGAGWAMLFGLVTAQLPRRAGDAIAAVAVGALFFGQAGYPLSAKAYEASIHPRPGTSDYELFKAYRPYLEGARRIGVLSSFGADAFFAWPITERCRCRGAAEVPLTPWDLNREQMRARTAGWLARTGADTIVALVETNPQPRYGSVHDWMLGQFDALDRQSRFVKVETASTPGWDIAIWRRRN